MVLLLEVKVAAFGKSGRIKLLKCEQSYQFLLRLVSPLYAFYIRDGKQKYWKFWTKDCVFVRGYVTSVKCILYTEPSECSLSSDFTKSNMAWTQKGRPLKDSEGKLGTREKSFPEFHGLEINMSEWIITTRGKENTNFRSFWLSEVAFVDVLATYFN